MPTKDQKKESFDLPNEEALYVEEEMWNMYFDGALSKKGFGIISFYGNMSKESASIQRFQIDN